MANVVFLWHMHQPYYVNPVTRTAMMPWVRLHAVKGYLDMISIIEDYPGVRVNFNLTPVLLLQIKELIDGEITDLWLEWARKPAADLNENEKLAVLENFFKINWDNLVKPYPRYWELLHKRGLTFYRDEVRRGINYFTTQELLDLQVWFNLAWCGYTADKLYPELPRLRAKGRDFTEEEKNRVLDIHIAILRIVLERYAAAEARGQVELTTTPFFHPILPLVYDSAFAERCLPGRKFPRRFHWPQDAAAQLLHAVEQHERLFGKKPRGLWPSEGSIAPELIPLMQKVGIQYFCTDEENLFNSIKRDPAYAGKAVDHLELFQGWRIQYDGAAVNAVFRERPLSDFIGFTASKNDPKDASRHLLHHMTHIASMVPHETGLIPLILDGENAWETFRDGGESFLRALYSGIEAASDRLRSCTIEDYFQRNPPRKSLTTLHTGSWICGNFDIWIGEDEENRAWDLLGQTRTFLQSQIDAGGLSDADRERALQEIYAAEGSDWFWWYGPDFSTENDDLFDELFRQHLKNVYAICGEPAPAALEAPITRARAAHVYRMPESLIEPEIDGTLSSYFEWLGAGFYQPGSEQSSMYRSERVLDGIWFGFGAESFYMRFDFLKWADASIKVVFYEPRGFLLKAGPFGVNGTREFTLTTPGGVELRRNSIAKRDIVEWEVPLLDLALKPGAPVAFQVRVAVDGIETEKYPEAAAIQLNVPAADFAAAKWIV
jgi:alpha-amylase/alpha-mannosidase (GH57 family)